MSAHAPTRFAVVLFPGFQSLDVFGSLDILNILSRRTDNLELSVLSSTLDPVSTHIDPSHSMVQRVVPTHTFQNPPEDIEVLLVPGGFGTRDRENIQPAVDFVKSVYPKLKYLLTVCTGSALVAMSGVLDGKRATSNKRSFAWVSDFALAHSEERGLTAYSRLRLRGQMSNGFVKHAGLPMVMSGRLRELPLVWI
jgi:putative intracellular protease/amidase